MNCEHDRIIASTGSQNVSIALSSVSPIMSRIRWLFASTTADDCKRLQLMGKNLESAPAERPRSDEIEARHEIEIGDSCPRHALESGPSGAQVG